MGVGDQEGGGATRVAPAAQSRWKYGQEVMKETPSTRACLGTEGRPVTFSEQEAKAVCGSKSGPNSRGRAPRKDDKKTPGP